MTSRDIKRSEKKEKTKILLLFCHNKIEVAILYRAITMAPGTLSGILAPFLGRKSKKYEKLETEDPEKKKRQEATQEEINRLNCKIVSAAPPPFSYFVHTNT